MVTFDDMIKEHEKHKEEEKEFRRKLNKLRMEDLRKKGIEPTFDEDGNSLIPPKKETWDHPNTMENSTATFLWIVVMLVGSIFKGNWMIWIIATIVWARFITRHDR
jgi:hypothetical protein